PLGLDVERASDSVSPVDVRPRPPQLAGSAVPRRERPAFGDLAAPGEPSDTENHMTQHPPLYYAAVAGASTFVGGLTPKGWWSWDREMYLYRLWSILLTAPRSEEHTSELQSRENLVCRLLLEKKNKLSRPSTDFITNS